ncbi:uncharacterized protein A1O5_07636 [Cladophialophora psammophila CBS 110553]|uniref:Uncharacterized protein n=1 Tax=Cladophialophora psammophila CBS 110553 TaxID=1182543 RepID=W9WX15_9EURO|nr:uncharacterized protein A1O5_07636 [Cladophialophora psammophila CBS 110553]EXJ69600.1 hypothetical protein A1O5_07636 [Cladophialophora psammophila CBS 110553]
MGVEALQTRAARRDDREERRVLFKWLDPSSINVNENLEEGLKHHHPGTGSWFFESATYISWSSGPSTLLWINGIPGSGKTVLASSIIQALRAQTAEPAMSLVYFYFDHRNSAKRTLKSFLGAILLQLICQHPDLLDEATSLYQKYEANFGNAISSTDLLALLTTSIQTVGTLVVVIDAVDECTELEDFVSALGRIVGTEGAIVRVIATGRHDHSLQKHMGTMAAYRVTLEHNIGGDISSFVRAEVNARVAARKIRIRSPELKALVIETLSREAGGMFLWVKFQLDIISKITNDKAIRGALRELPRGLENTYIRVLEQVKEQNAHDLDAVCKMLMWLVSCLTPLTLSQLVEAVSIKPNDSERDLEKMVTDENDLLEILGSLVVVDRDQDDPVVSLAHFTLYEFLVSHRLRGHEALSMFFIPARGYLDVGLSLVQYLSFSDFREPCATQADLIHRTSSNKLLLLAARHWFTQLRALGGRGPLSNYIHRLQWFIEPCRKGDFHFVSWQQAYHGSVSDLPQTNPLVYAHRFGMSNLFDILIQKGADTQALSEDDYSPLAIAVISGKKDLVATLLQSKPRPDLEAQYGRGLTCLHLAAERGKEDIVHLLLEAGASPHARSVSGTTPLYRAARAGSIATMELLLNADSEINAETWDGWTAIFEAIENHHVGATRWLIARGADVKRKLGVGTSVLEFAQFHENAEIIQIVEEVLRSPLRTF